MSLGVAFVFFLGDFDFQYQNLHLYFQINTFATCFVALLRYPFYAHMIDICVGLKDMFTSAGLWQLGIVAVPASLPMPAQSPESLNKSLMQLFFGPNLEDMPALPEGVTLYMDDDVMRAKLWTRERGSPPDQVNSFFFDEAPLLTWYLQGRGHWAYAMPLNCKI